MSISADDFDRLDQLTGELLKARATGDAGEIQRCEKALDDLRSSVGWVRLYDDIVEEARGLEVRDAPRYPGEDPDWWATLESGL